MRWKVVIAGPGGPVLDGTAFNLLYSFPSKAEAEAHAECFGFAGTKIIPCEEPEKLADLH